MKKPIFLSLYIVAILIRLIAIFIVIKNPLIGWLTMYLIDTFDYGFALRSGLTFRQYQYIDKSVDLLNMFYLVVGAKFYNFPNFNLYIGLLLFRAFGEFLFLKTKSDKFLFFFPNVIEYLFPLQIFFNWSLPTLLLASLALKIPHEYLLHIMHWVDPVSKRYIKEHPEHQRKV